MIVNKRNNNRTKRLDLGISLLIYAKAFGLWVLNFGSVWFLVVSANISDAATETAVLVCGGIFLFTFIVTKKALTNSYKYKQELRIQSLSTLNKRRENDYE